MRTIAWLILMGAANTNSCGGAAVPVPPDGGPPVGTAGPENNNPQPPPATTCAEPADVLWAEHQLYQVLGEEAHTTDGYDNYAGIRDLRDMALGSLEEAERTRSPDCDGTKDVCLARIVAIAAEGRDAFFLPGPSDTRLIWLADRDGTVVVPVKHFLLLEAGIGDRLSLDEVSARLVENTTTPFLVHEPDYRYAIEGLESPNVYLEPLEGLLPQEAITKMVTTWGTVVGEYTQTGSNGLCGGDASRVRCFSLETGTGDLIWLAVAEPPDPPDSDADPRPPVPSMGSCVQYAGPAISDSDGRTVLPAALNDSWYRVYEP